MYLLIIFNFIFTCCLGVFFYIQLKDKEDDIEELYNLFYEKEEKERNMSKKGKVVKYDKFIY